MTLIPLLSALAANPQTSVKTAGPAMAPRNSYDPGAGHRPLAATFAIGLPVALVVAVALSPMVTKFTEKAGPIIIETIPLPAPDPDPAPSPQPQQRQNQPAVVPIPSPLPAPDAPVFDPPPPYLPPAGSGTGPTIVDPPPVAPPAPKLVLAELDGRFANVFQPDYPASEQRREIEGSAKVKVLIGTDGRVKAVELISTDSPGFFEETKRRALAKWRFKPATRGGVPEESWKVMSVRFQIKNA